MTVEAEVNGSEYIGSVTAIRTEVPTDAHTASYLGSEREGSAVLIDDQGTVLTIGYLLLESNRVWIRAKDTSWVPADIVGALVPELVVKPYAVIHQPH